MGYRPHTTHPHRKSFPHMKPTITTDIRSQLAKLAARAEARDLRQREFDTSATSNGNRTTIFSLSPVLGYLARVWAGR